MGNEAGLRVILRERKLPYQEWFEGQDRALGYVKATLFLDMGVIELSASFEDLRPWLRELNCFSQKASRLSLPM